MDGRSAWLIVQKKVHKINVYYKIPYYFKTFQSVVVSITRYVAKIVRNRAILGYYKEEKTTLTIQL